jgi:hypothetical protein
MYKYWIMFLLTAVFAVSTPSCAKKVGCPANNDNTPTFDGSKRKASKTKSGISTKTSKYKRKRH